MMISKCVYMYVSTTRNLSSRTRNNPFLELNPKPLPCSHTVRSERASRLTLNPIAKLHPQRFIDDGLLNDHANDDMPHNQTDDFLKHLTSEPDSKSLLQPPILSIESTERPGDELKALRSLIDHGDVERSLQLVKKLCMMSKKSQESVLPQHTQTDLQLVKKTEPIITKPPQTSETKDMHINEHHPIKNKIKCLLMNTFYCVPDDSACEDTLRVELETKKAEWTEYRKHISRIIHALVVKWYLDGQNAVSLVHTNEMQLGAKKMGIDTDKTPISDLKKNLLRTKVVTKPNFLLRNQDGRLSSPLRHGFDSSRFRYSSSHNHLDINLVVKALRPEFRENSTGRTKVHFSVGVRGDSFPESLSKRITMTLNEGMGFSCPISATFDLYFSIVYRP